MNSNPASPALRRARQHLAAAMEEAELRGDGCLPTLARLSFDAGVARVTMFRAVREACGRGELTASRGRRIRLASHNEARSAPAEKGPKWVRVRERILAELYSGGLQTAGPFPTAAQVARSYGVNPHTAARALRSLAERGIVAAGQERLDGALVRRTAGGGTVVLFTVGDTYGNVEESSSWVAPNLRALEQHCAEAGLRLDVHLWRRQEDGRLARPDALRGSGRIERPFGVVLWTQSLELAEAELALEFARTMACPAAVLDESGEFRSSLPGAIPDLLVVRYDQYQAGYSVGSFLLRAGHRRALFVAPDLQHVAARLRLAGLRASFEEAGVHEAVEAPDLGLTNMDMPDRPAADTGDTIAEEALRRSGVDRNDMPERIAPHAGAIKFACDRLSHLATYDTRLYAALGQAAHGNSATAWVGFDDPTALECLRRTRNDGSAGAAVCGFDDSVEARMCGLTSYNFGGVEAMRAVVRHLVSPGLTPRLARQRPATLLARGFVVERRSCRALPARGSTPPSR